jgi:hypothetical protein
MPSTLPQPAPTRVASSILNWDGAAKTRRCLQTVATILNAPSLPYRVRSIRVLHTALA